MVQYGGNQWVDSQDALADNRLLQISPAAQLTYSDGSTAVATATRVLLGVFPAKSIITRAFIYISTNFNASGNDYLTVGTSDDDDLLVNDADISTASSVLTVVSSSTLPYYVAADTVLYATYVYSSTAPTTGVCQVALEWVPWNVRDRVTL